MPANSTAQPALDESVQAAGSAMNAKLDAAIDELKDRAAKVAQDTLETIRTRAKPYLDETFETLRTRAKPYVEDAGEQLEVAERYIVERVQKQPLTTTMAVLGVGVLIGLFLGSGRQR